MCGWVHALPRIIFDIMNSINASTGFSNFQIRLGQSLCLIPPLIPHTLTPMTTKTNETQCARKLITELETDVNEAKDNLLHAKVFQTFYANQDRSPEVPFNIGNKVMLLTLHRHQPPNSPNMYPTYHASKLKPFLPNDTSLFPSCELSQPKPVLTPDSLEEYLVQEIIHSHR
jgi:hypothetical protein